MQVTVRYADKSAFVGPWSQAPAFEVQTIAYLDPHDRPRVRHGGDYYQLDEGEVVPIDKITLIQQALAAGWIPPAEGSDLDLLFWAVDNGYKLGTMVGPEKWRQIYQLGKTDRDVLRSNG